MRKMVVESRLNVKRVASLRREWELLWASEKKNLNLEEKLDCVTSKILTKYKAKKKENQKVKKSTRKIFVNSL